MKAGNRPAGDGDEDKGKQLAAEDRPGAINEAGHRRHLDFRMQDDDGHRQRGDGAQLHESGQIIAWRQQQPDRQHRRREAVADDHERQRLGAVVEQAAPVRMMVDDAAAPHRQQQQAHAQYG